MGDGGPAAAGMDMASRVAMQVLLSRRAREFPTNLKGPELRCSAKSAAQPVSIHRSASQLYRKVGSCSGPGLVLGRKTDA